MDPPTIPDDERFEDATVREAANVYCDGRATSRELHTADGERVTPGITLPGEYTFETSEPEEVERLAGSANVDLPDGSSVEVSAGESFAVPGDSEFVISTDGVVDYVCRYGEPVQWIAPPVSSGDSDAVHCSGDADSWGVS